VGADAVLLTPIENPVTSLGAVGMVNAEVAPEVLDPEIVTVELNIAFPA